MRSDMTDQNTTSEIETSVENVEFVESPNALAERTPFEVLTGMAIKTVSEQSGRVYQVTYNHWQKWSEVRGVGLLDLWPNNVMDFLASRDTTVATRKRELNALRALARIAAIIDGDQAKKMYELLKLTKHVPTPNDQITANQERDGVALTPAECTKLLAVNAGSDDPKFIRDQAIIATLLFTGLRRSELAKLEWRDVDLVNATVNVRHGKGDKNRSVAIMDGDHGTAVNALKAWYGVQADDSVTGVQDRKFVFCGVTKGGNLRPDKPVNSKTIERVVTATAAAAHIEKDIVTHDLRRTHITEYLATGGTLAGAQEQAGHVNGSTTLRYAQSVNAQKRRGEARFRFS